MKVQSVRALDLYMALSQRLLRLRREKGTSDADETAWASVLDVIWHDMSTEEQAEANAVPLAQAGSSGSSGGSAGAKGT